MALPEAERAAEFRRKMTARADWECDQRYRALPGDPDAAAEVVADWEPITDPERGWDAIGCPEYGEGLQVA